jgi:signal transduction histidine kinase
VLPAILAVLLVAEQLAVRPPRMPVAIVGAMVMAVALGGRRDRPLLAVTAVPCVLAAEALLGVSTKQTSLPILPAFWAVFLTFAVLRGRRRAAGLVLLTLGMATGMLFDGGHADWRNLGHSVLFTVALCVPAAVTGTYVAARHRYTAAVEERARAVEAQRVAETSAALAEERLRIARELHDVIAHSVGLMGVQAGAVRRRLDPGQDTLRETLLSVEQTGRAAIEELRHVLGVLRGGEVEVSMAPQPTLADLTTLVSAAEAAGQHVSLQVDGEPHALPSGVDISAYRVVQELLTNARKHAAGAAVDLRVEYAADAVRIRASNPVAAPGQAGSAAGGGHGLLGMRERVHAFGGTLRVDCAGGRFAVIAILPTHSAVALS